MKTTLLSFLLSVIFLSFLLTACKKAPTQNAKLPPITQEGKNTIGFTIGGEVWVPYAECSFMGDPCRELLVRYGESNGAAPGGIDWGFTRVRKRSKKSSHLTITSTGVGTITSTGDKIDSIFISYQDERTEGGYVFDYWGPLPGSKFIITKFDYPNQIISGEFEFVLRKYNGNGETITIKDGRFDFKLNTCKCSN